MKKLAAVSIFIILFIAGCADGGDGGHGGDDNPKSISIMATQPTIWENSGDYLEFVINIGSPNETSDNIIVYYNASGTALDRGDIAGNPFLQQGYVEIPPGLQTAAIRIEDITGNGIIEETQTVILSIAGCSSGEYPIGPESEATAIIMDSDGEIVTDIDGNSYHTVLIGAQTWIVENLKTTRFRNGNPISESWYCNDDCRNMRNYGRLYSWYAVMDFRGLAPEGWHVPTDDEWKQLIDYLGGEEVAGGKLKATTLWQSPNTGATNETGFTAFPGGFRRSDGVFDGFGWSGNFWTASESDYSAEPYCHALDYRDSSVYSYTGPSKVLAFTVRCVKD